MAELTLEPREITFQPKSVDVAECNSFTDAFERLKSLPPGIALLDSDNTMREPIKAGKAGKFGKVPSEVLSQIDELKEKGWKIAVVTNQPYTGKGKSHQVARVLSKARGYEAFPACFERRDIEIFGGGWGFLVKHFKKSREAIRKVQNWVKKQEKVKKVDIVMVGDRESDVEFTNRLASKVQGEKFVRSIKMFKLPGKDRGLARLTP